MDTVVYIYTWVVEMTKVQKAHAPLSLSLSQETDASLLTVTGYPAFAIDNPDLQQATEIKVKETLAGEKGYKRFLRDSYLTVREGSRDSTGDTSVSGRERENTVIETRGVWKN